MKNVLLTAVLALVAAMPMTSQAQSTDPTDEQLLMEIETKILRLDAFLLRRGDHLSRQQLEETDYLLDQIQRVVRGRDNSGNRGTQCTLLGFGRHAGWDRNYRVAVGVNVMEGTNDFNAALRIISDFRQSGICVTPVFVQDLCGLKGFGRYAGWDRNYRVTIEDDVIFASNDYSAAVSVLDQLNSNKICALRPTQNCQLLPRGRYAGWDRNYRVAIGNEVVLGTNDRSAAIQHLNSLRDKGLCY